MKKVISKNNPIRSIPEVKDQLDKYCEHKRILKKERAKINSLFDKYAFLNQLTNPKKQKSTHDEDIQLEHDILALFKDAGYKTHKPRTNADFDVIAICGTHKIGIEVKNGNLPSENDLFQARKYATRKEETEKIIYHPIIVWNNATTNQEFDKNRILDANLNRYGLLTTNELLKGFIKLKQKTITFDEFNSQIDDVGLIKFSNRAIKKKMESPLPSKRESQQGL
jgi:hypothetical protein